MALVYTFDIENTQKNWEWVTVNLDDWDYKLVKKVIRISYYNVMTRNEILKALALL